MHECDLVMKGGVTSGTVYPRAIAHLSEYYRFCSIGGTSAGAIAAAATAAAEYRRQKSAARDDTGGFDELSRLPDALGKPGAKGSGSTLQELFQPQRRFKALLGLLLSFVGSSRTKEGSAKSAGSMKVSSWLLIGRVCLAAIRHFWGYAFLGAVLSLAFARLLGAPIAWSWHAVFLALFVFAGAAAFSFWGIWRTLQALPANDFGMCKGFDADAPEDRTQLTPWLYDLIQRTAGRGPAGPPLTFGDLEGLGITFRAVTSNLSYGLPHRLPFGPGDAWPFFDEKEWSRIFPRSVIDHLKAHPPRPDGTHKNDRGYAEAVVRLKAEQGLLPLPDGNDLPLIVAVRLSLSFPVLLSALPLYLLDPTEGDAAPARKCWFSDGGISSNFPLHFFDSAIPSRPTFAINLEEVASIEPGAERALLPKTNQGGLGRAWKPMGQGGNGTAALSDFLLAIFNVLQNWRDNALLRLPGYRDRVATVRLAPHEGGLNLNMPKAIITALSGYGEEAAKKLALHFLPENAQACKEQNIATTWQNHRWIRLLSTLGGLERIENEFQQIWTQDPASLGSYRDLLDPAKTPAADLPSYKNFSAAQRSFALICLDQTQALVEVQRLKLKPDPMTENTPRPAMRFRLTPEQ
jgi:predicted acylesterase/phospholipase RssA